MGCGWLFGGCSMPAAEMVVVNARIWPGAGLPEARAMAVRNGKVVAIGTIEDVNPHVGPYTEVFDAEGRRVIPGITDSHLHFISGGQHLARLRLRQVEGREAFVKAIVDEVARLDDGQWVLGGRWSTESWPDPSPPTKEWIDPVTPNNPVFLVRMDGHQALANSAALAIAGIDSHNPPDPEGGIIERDPATGEPTGIVKDDAMALLREHIPPLSAEQRYQALLRAMKHANSWGITSIHDMSEPEDLAIYERAYRAKNLTLRIRSYVMDEDWPPHFKRVKQFRVRNDKLRVAGFKGFMDGSLGSKTAYMRQPYEDNTPDEGDNRGILTAMASPLSEMQHRIEEADRQRWQIAVHAIGDEANHQLLNIYEHVMQTNPGRDRRHRVEHAQHLLEDDIERFGKLGVVASMQPYHKADDGRYAEARLGKERSRFSYAFNSLLTSNARVCFGSDWPVVSLNPFIGIATAVTGMTQDGRVWVPEQNISVEQAVTAYTATPAWVAFTEDRLGTLEVGKRADFCVLSQDIFSVPAEDIARTCVTHTVFDGEIVYPPQEAGSPPAD